VGISTDLPSFRGIAGGRGYNPGDVAEEHGNGGGRVERLLERRLKTIPSEVSEALGLRMRAAFEAVQDRTSGSLDGLRATLAGVEERLASTLTTLADSLETLPAGTRGAMDAALDRLRADLETVHAIPQQMARALTIVRDAVGEIAGSQEAVGERIGDLSQEMTRVRDEVVRRAIALDDRIVGMERLAGVIDSLAKKRGFKDLVRSEKLAMEQQEGFVERLVSLGEELASHTQELRDRVDEVSQQVEGLAGRLGGVEGAVDDRAKLAGALDDLRDRVAAELKGGLDRLSERIAAGSDREEAVPAAAQLPEGFVDEVVERIGAQLLAVTQELRPEADQRALTKEIKDVGRNQRDVEKVVRAARTELERVRKRMDTWGRVKSAPRMAEEVTGLEERVIELERAVGEELADEVAERLDRRFERRFEALVQLLDARTAPQAPPEGDSRRGIFRR